MKFFIVFLFGFICGIWAIDSHTNPNQPIIWGKCVVATNFCKFKIYTKNGINKKKNMQRWDYSRTSRACGDSKCSADNADCSYSITYRNTECY
ncbi:unnamed protein product [Clonostachys chloroleuca]|uniref:Uncharacterized protein n=1 Tax=Clonostachys chloroleuca TaxID=1926264 RepID=A0AA35LWI2_9HYPO|nr:unnamed protein product [Clonostachys chloroleuca]